MPGHLRVRQHIDLHLPVEQARVQEFARGGAQNLKAFFFLLFNFSGGGGPAQKLAEKMTFLTKK